MTRHDAGQAPSSPPFSQPVPPRHRGRRRRPRPSPPPLIFRGWLVVAGAFLVMAVGYGAAYSYAAFADTLVEAFGTSHASLSMVYGLCGFTAFTVSAVSGPLADRIGPRPLAAAGMALVAVGLLTTATAKTLVEVYLSYGLLIGLGIGFAYVPAVAAVQRWFFAWRGLASGIAAAGIGVGTALVPPASAVLGHFGDWRMAFVLSGVAVAVVGMAGAMLLAASPEGYGLSCDGLEERPERTTHVAPQTEAGIARALRGKPFWLHYFGTLLVSVPVSLPFAHLAHSAESAGIARQDALYLLSVVGIGSIAGRFALGAVADGIGRRATFLACCAAVTGLTVLWAASDSHAAFVAFAVGFGAAYGGFVALLPAVTADRFGRCSAGGIIGILYTGRGIALLLSAPLLAALAGEGGGYGLPLGLMAVLGAMGLTMLALGTDETR